MKLWYHDGPRIDLLESLAQEMVSKNELDLENLLKEIICEKFST